MAESSIFWTTGSTGDGASPYTQAQVVDWLRRTFLNAPASEGVLKGYSNELAPSGAASPVAIAAGAAMVYGFPYENTAPVNVTIPTPSIGTTGHRIVLRVSWAAQTVRIALKSSSDGVASIPALTQTANTTWEISLATLTITTGGVITVTDARGWAHPNFDVKDLSVTTGKLADDAVTNAKIGAGAVGTTELANNAVDDTKAGNRVPFLYRRQGSDANEWYSYGGTTYTPGAVKEQMGMGGILVINNGTKNVSADFTYPVAFGYSPLVIATLVPWVVDFSAYEAVALYISNVTTTGFKVTLRTTANVGGDRLFAVMWLAVGTE